MLLNCPSCNTQYLLNSADLQPDGKKVLCAHCSFQWFQDSKIIDNEVNEKENIQINLNNTKNYQKSLPSTYVEPDKPSITNSFILILIVILLIGLYFFVRNLDNGTIDLIKFYTQELIIKFDLTLNLLSEVLHNILN